MGDFGRCLVAGFEELREIIHGSGATLQPERLCPREQSRDAEIRRPGVARAGVMMRVGGTIGRSTQLEKR